MKLLEIKNLKKYFHLDGEIFKAVDDVSFDIFENETLALVGESGCGKSTLGKMLSRLITPTSGDVFFNQKNLFSFKKNDLFLRKQIQIVFQDPFSSLNPKMSIKDIVEEPLKIHKIENKKQVDDLLEILNLSAYKNHFPHELSGGQKQRVAIARALILNPRFIVCDEPVSSLDISIQAQIVSLLKDLQKKLKLTYLFISHDLKIVKYLSDRIAVMKNGKIVELREKKDLFSSPIHPYTKELLSIQI
jgi:ABC-type oligopeptide transport system ATPase subunit